MRPALHSLAFEQVVPYPSYPRDRRTDEKSMKGLASCRRYLFAAKPVRLYDDVDFFDFVNTSLLSKAVGLFLMQGRDFSAPLRFGRKERKRRHSEQADASWASVNDDSLPS